jgi:NAD(P)-dependent dehydrogenase (short-subunit alcohol dehydrogenase family)
MSNTSEVPAGAGGQTDPQPPFTPGRFTGRTAIVTGAGSGIGRATALRLAREGARVVAADIDADRLEQLAAEFPDLDLVPVATDIATDDGVRAVVAAAEGRVDALANVAGIMDAFLPPAEVDDATWERVFAVNVTAVMRLTRAVLPMMLAAGGGAIVNVSSEASLRASASGVAYTASKHAVNGITKSTAVFYKGNGIRANAVAPGPVATNIQRPSSPSTPPGSWARSCRPPSPRWPPPSSWPPPSPGCSATTPATSTGPSCPPTAAGRPSEGPTSPAGLGSGRLGRGRVAWLVEAELDPAGEGDGGEQAPALVADRPCDLDPLGLEGRHGGGDVVAEQVELGPAARLGRVDGDLGRRECEDQPAAASVDRPGAEDLGQCRPGRVGVLAVEDGVRAVDHGRILAGPTAVVKDRRR